MRIIEDSSTLEDNSTTYGHSTSYGSTARFAVNHGVSSKKKLFDSLFPKWEMELYPPGLTKAIEKVERHDFIKNALNSFGKFDYNNCAPPDSITGKVKHRHKGHNRIRLDRLPISELHDMKDNNVFNVLSHFNTSVFTRQKITCAYITR